MEIFGRYAIIFAAVNLFSGITINYLGHLLSKGLYMIMLLSGILANIMATLLVMFYCLDHKDEFMAEFHRQGLAKEFLMVGEWNIPENFKLKNVSQRWH